MWSRRLNGRVMWNRAVSSFKVLLLVTSLSLGLSACGSAEPDVNKENMKNMKETASSNMPGSSESYAEIKSVLYDSYLGGQKNSSVETIRRAFHSDSVMMFPQSDEAGKSYLQKWTDMHSTVVEWAEPGNPDLNLDNFEILSMDVVDERMAVVIFKIEDRVYDAITLLKIENDWKIVSKVYILQ